MSGLWAKWSFRRLEQGRVHVLPSWAVGGCLAGDGCVRADLEFPVLQLWAEADDDGIGGCSLTWQRGLTRSPLRVLRLTMVALGGAL